MKSAYKIAKEIGVTPQAIYKRLNTDFRTRLNGHIEENGNKTLFDEVAEQHIKQAFNRAEQPIGDVVQPVVEPVNQPNIQLHSNSSSTGLLVEQPSSSTGLSVKQLGSSTDLTVEQPSSPTDSSVKQQGSPTGLLVEQPSSPTGLLVEQPSSPTNSSVEQLGSPTGLSVKQPNSLTGLSVEQPQSNHAGYHSINNPPDLISQMMISQRQEMADLLTKLDRFVDVLDKPRVHSLQHVDEPLTNPLVDQLQTENKFLRKQNQDLTEELKVEREHGRSQAVKLSDLMTQYSEITKNQQVLLGREQGLNNSGIILNPPEDEAVSFKEEAAATVNKEEVKDKRGFWHKIFNRK